MVPGNNPLAFQTGQALFDARRHDEHGGRAPATSSSLVRVLV